MSTLMSSFLQVPEAPAGQLDLPAGGALRAPPVGRSMRSAGAAGTPNIIKFTSLFKFHEILTVLLDHYFLGLDFGLVKA